MTLINKIFFLKVWLVLLSLLLSVGGKSQNVNQLNASEPYKYPWAGGMNSMQFGELDINRDGIKDLVAFDRQGNRIMPFINGGAANQIDYSYEPEFIDDFPELYDWAVFADYNMDGKADIFTYSPGWAGMMVYQNVSDDKLKFKRVVYPYLSSLNNGGEVNILVTYADYPGITDLDNDGDLDILTFWGLGSFVEMHKNLSMETYGNADSLIFEKTEECWGHFAESDESNELFLDTCVPSKYGRNRKLRHTGSTFLMLDLDGDDDKDLLLGDVDYPGLFALINGGTPKDAYIDSFDTLFPDEDSRIRMFSMPAAAYIDVNNDGLKDLIVSPFDPAPLISKNLKSVKLYLNKGTNNVPDFLITQQAFLQRNMIDVGSGAMPVLYDWDGDGFTDLFIGNYGYYTGSWYDEYYTLHSSFKGAVAYYKNVGTWGYPVFQRVDWDFGGFYLDNEPIMAIAPAFGDIDGDGKSEMVAGNSDGTLILVEVDDADISKTKDYFSIDVGKFSTPQLFDLDNDGLLDLIIGEQNGNLNYYHNDGTATNPDFVFVTDSLGKVNVTDYSVSWYGYSTPAFYRDHQGKTSLVVGSEQGKLFYFVDIDGNLTGKFTQSDDLGALIGLDNFKTDRGMRTAASISDICVDITPELIVGNFSGGLELFGGDAEAVSSIPKNTKNQNLLAIAPNPASTRVTVTLPEKSNYYRLNIYDLSGRLLLSKHYQTTSVDNIEVDVSMLKSGIYIVKLINANEAFSGELVVMK